MNELDNKSKIDYHKKHIFTILNKITGVPMVSEGSLGFWGYKTDYSKVHGYYYFKMKNNEARVKEIELKEDGTYTINAMMRNVPIPPHYEVICHEVELSDDEKRKNELLRDIHKGIVQWCCGDPYFSFYFPSEVNLKSINKTVMIKSFSRDCEGIDGDVINHDTDKIRVDSLSNEDLEFIYKKYFG